MFRAAEVKRFAQRIPAEDAVHGHVYSKLDSAVALVSASTASGRTRLLWKIRHEGGDPRTESRPTSSHRARGSRKRVKFAAQQ
jgi:hypothetical protein